MVPINMPMSCEVACRGECGRPDTCNPESNCANICEEYENPYEGVYTETTYEVFLQQSPTWEAVSSYLF